jgi:hypothetical protein
VYLGLKVPFENVMWGSAGRDTERERERERERESLRHHQTFG